jgi:hypothetical protein
MIEQTFDWMLRRTEGYELNIDLLGLDDQVSLKISLPCFIVNLKDSGYGTIPQQWLTIKRQNNPGTTNLLNIPT